MTEEEIIEFLGKENVVAKEEQEEIYKKVMNGELICLGGPTQKSYDFVKNPVKVSVTQEMIDAAKRRWGIS